MVNIYCVNTKTSKSFPEGLTLMEMLPSFIEGLQTPYPIIAAKVNNVVQGLKYRAFNSRSVEFLDCTTDAASIAIRSVSSCARRQRMSSLNARW